MGGTGQWRPMWRGNHGGSAESLGIVEEGYLMVHRHALSGDQRVLRRGLSATPFAAARGRRPNANTATTRSAV